MHSKVIDITKNTFDEKYSLYGSMLYRLGIVYLGKDEYVIEAMREAFLWLFKGKKAFKDSDEERLDLLSHMVIICESRSRRKPKKDSQTEEGVSIGTSFPESMDMLEALYGLPNKYKPVLHLALYENMDVYHISKILSIPKFIIKKLLAKGIELTEMVLERKLDRDYYCHIMNGYVASLHMKEDIWFYITEGKPHVKTYLSPMQKCKTALATIAIPALCIGAIRLYPVLKPSINTKYAFMNGTIRSITLNNIYTTDVPGVLFASSGNDYQGYTLDGNSLKQIETKHVTKDIEYSGHRFPLNFYYCIKDGHIAVLDSSTYNDYGVAYIDSQDYTTEKVLVILYHYDTENLENRENGEGLFIYPLILDLNTLETTDFISNCGISDFNNLLDANLNERIPGAIISTKNSDIYYLDIKSSSYIKLGNIESSYLNSAHFYNDETIIYSVNNNETSVPKYVTSYYEYSISTNTIKKCYEFDSSSNKELMSAHANTILLRNPDKTYSIVDITTGTSTNIPNLQEDNELYFIPTYSPDGRHILFEIFSDDILVGTYKGSSERVKDRVYIYDMEVNRTLILSSSDYKDIYFKGSFWYDNDHIALWKKDIVPNNPYPSGSSLKVESILWIFDINKLK